MTNNKKDNKNLTDNELYYSKVCEKNRKIIQNATRDGITVCGFARGIMDQMEDDALLYGEMTLDLDLFETDKKNKNK
tara:strand:- start:263 stop:493 length:231 start_codon:yes stop_codon:yes gene_type:complete